MAAVEAVEIEDLISASFPVRPVRPDPSPHTPVRNSPFLYVSRNSGVHVFAPLYTYRTYSAGYAYGYGIYKIGYYAQTMYAYFESWTNEADINRTCVSGVIIKPELLRAVYRKRGDILSFVSPRQLDGVHMDEECTESTPYEVVDDRLGRIGFGRLGIFYFDADFLDRFTKAFKVYVVPRGIVVGKYGTYTSMFTVAGSQTDHYGQREVNRGVVATVMHIPHTSKVLYARELGQTTLDPASGVVIEPSHFSAGFVDLSKLGKILRECSSGYTCIRGIELADPCELTDKCVSW